MITWIIFIVAAVVAVAALAGKVNQWVGGLAILIVVAALIGFVVRRSGPPGPG